ncbi:hypothetical protein [Nonomuraea sp. SBT364]|uniref:hypothetical protein n=1 Tax=Nonomuraea sp. SBT364 TaxID=1580530 RepID=UPI000A9A0A6D|nr:hypothetical protein [Nonomuraea sp. SBT364]
MKLIRKIVVGVSMAAMAVSGTVMSAAVPAHAEVWGCDGIVESDNEGHGICYDGFGPYHVRVSCASAHWPYTREIDGPVVWKASNQPGPLSTVRGDGSGCHVTRAWVIVL